MAMAAVSLLFFACPSGEEPSGGPSVKAEAPSITVQPGDYQSLLDESVSLAVTATVTDGGTLSYQWYSASAVGVTGAKIEEATDRTYSPPTDTAGTVYYYVEVSNANIDTRTSTKSRYATIFVVDPDELETPRLAQYYIVIDAEESGKRQFVRGFGGMINAWGAPCPDVTLSDADTLFNPDKLGLNILRMIIYPEPLEDIMGGLVYTSVDNSDLFDIGKLVNRYGGIIVGCPWTPPDGLKLANGHLDPAKYREMGQHLVTWVQKMEAGMGGNNTIFAISSQNEPDSNATWCIYTPEENRDFVKQVFPWIKEQLPHVMLFPGEYTDFNEDLYMPIVEDPAALAAVDGFAGHFYGGAVGARKGKLIETGKEIWMTEHLRNTNNNRSYDPTWAAVWDFANDFHNCMINDYNAYIYWYAKRFYGLIGDSEPGVTNQRDGAPQLRGLLMSHYSKYAAGKHRYATEWVASDWTASASAPANVLATAYMDDETVTMVMVNKSTVSSGNAWVHVRLPEPVQAGFAVVTYNSTGPDPTLSAIAPTTVQQQPIPVQFSEDKLTASVKMPPSSFLSIRFYK
jgi:glucuronoarabinoxylan endo-1,4-beta-xylanase